MNITNFPNYFNTQQRKTQQTSYEAELDVQQKQLQNFQTLSSRRDELTNELSAARTDCEAYATAETTLDITQHNRLSLRVSSYCEEYGLTPYDFESYLQERHKLAGACFAAQQRVSELLYAAEGTTAGEAIRQKEPTQVSATSLKDNFDTVEISDSALKRFQRTQFQYADPEMKQTER